jgi:serine/threonine-protein kinase
MRRVEVPYAASVEQRTETVLDEYAVTWKRVHTEACEAATVRGEVSSKTMDAQMACLHRAKAELAGVTRVLAEPDETVVGKAHELLAGLSPLEVCADTEVLQADVEPPPVEDAATVATIEKLLADGRAERMAGRHAAARELLQEARTVAEKVEYEPIEMELAFQEGFLLYELGEYEPAEQAYRRAFEAAARSHRRSLMARSAGQLISIVGVKLNRPDEGMSFARIGGGLARGNLRDEALVANGTGTILVMQGDLEGAEAAIRRALEQLVEVQGPDHPGVLRVRTNLGNVLYQQGKYAEAEAEQRRALEGWEASLGPSHPNVATALNNLGSALHAQGKYEDAEVELRRALELREQLLEPNHPALAQSHGNLAGALHGQHEDAKAEVELRRAVEILEKARGAESPEVAQFRNNLAILLRIQGKLEEAETEHRRILDVWRKVFGPVHPLVASSLTNLGLVLHDRGKLEEAEVELAAALQVREQALGTDHPDTAESRTNLARLVLERGRARDAVTLAEMAWTHQQRGDVPPAHRAATAFVLARASWAADADASRSRGWAERALQAHEQAGTIDGEQAAAVREWMRRHLGP